MGGRIAPVKAFVVRSGKMGRVNGVSEGREGIALIAQRIADNVRMFSRCISSMVLFY